MYKKENLYLLKMDKTDLARLLSLKSESWGSTHRKTIANMDDQRRWYDSIDQDVHSPKNLIMMAWSKAINGDVMFGVFKIFDVDYINRTANVAWDVFSEYRGKKLGKGLVQIGTDFCKEILNLRRLDAEILSFNEPSKKCALAAGFVEEGVRRKAVHMNGEYVDSVVYGKLWD